MEATGLRWWLPGFKLTLAQFGDEDDGWAFRPDRFGILLEEVMTQYQERITGLNLLGYDFHALLAAGFSLPDKRLVSDTFIMSKLAQADRHTHSLDDNIELHVGPEARAAKHAMDETFAFYNLRPHSRKPEESERAWTEIARIDPESFRTYSTMDPVSAARIDGALYPIVQRDYKDAYEREMGAWWVTFEGVHKGLPVDVPYAEKLYDEMERDITVVRTQLAELGVPSPGARQKIAHKLIGEGWVPQEFNLKSGAPKFDKAVLEGLDHEVVAPLIEWSRLTKWQTAYVGAILDGSYKGRVYPSVNAMGAKTGRESAYGPPIHQLPSRHPDAPKVRRMFLPEPGDQMVSIDYMAEEDRLSVHFSHDAAMRLIFDKGLKKHRYTAAGVYGIDYDAVSEEQYARIKGYSYAAAYGAQDKKLGKMLGIPIGEVAAIRERTNSVYSGFAEYSDQLAAAGRAQYYADGAAYATTIGGRKVYADQGKYGEPQYYTLVNYVNQGSGADILKEAKNRIAAAGLSHHLMFAVHDEVLLSVPPGREGEATALEIGHIMEFTNNDSTFGTPLSIDMLTSVGELSDYWSGH